MSRPILSRRTFLGAAAGAFVPLALPAIPAAASRPRGAPATGSPAIPSGDLANRVLPPLKVKNSPGGAPTAPASPTVTSPATASLQVATSGPSALHRTVFAFYYPWFEAPPFNPTYGHWDGGGALTNLPSNIASAFYPLIPPYDCDNPPVVQLHMAWMQAVGIDVAILSWWGQGSRTDQFVPGILSAAAGVGLRVAFQIEPYAGRTIASIMSDIAYLYARYGGSAAFYRAARPTLYGPSSAPRGVFFIYDLPGAYSTIAAFDAIRGTTGDAILLGRMDDSLVYKDADVRQQLSYCHADGLYAYDPLPSPSVINIAALPTSPDYVTVHCAIPGWDKTRMYPAPLQERQDRQSGAFYDSQWAYLYTKAADNVAIVSFNEWAEGSQVEPATPFSFSGYTYTDYSGAYGLTGTLAPYAPYAYLLRTAQWSQLYKS